MEEPLDIKWFDRISKLNAQITQNLKVSNYTEAKKLFENSELVEPAFVLSKLEGEKYCSKVASLKELRVEITNCRKTNPEVKKIYKSKIDEKLQQFELLSRLKLQCEGNSQSEHLKSLTEKIYGRPDEQVFNHLITRLRDDLHRNKGAMVDTVEYAVLDAVFSNVPESTIKPLEPIPSQNIGSKIFNDSSEVSSVILKELKNQGLNNWRVQISISEVGSFMVWPNSKRIIVPSSKMLASRKRNRVLTETNLMSVVHHEVLTHAVRSENGMNSRLLLLGIGLAGYWRGEEGLATYREQLISGADDYANQNTHLAICLAYGFDRGGLHRNFREVYLILYSYYKIFISKTDKHAKDRAFCICHRVFAGATGSGTAFVLTRDISYREGNIAIHALINNTPITKYELNVGKYDPTNLEHVKSLVALRILSRNILSSN